MILVTGGAGYIGSHIALALVDSGTPPIVLDDLSTGWPALVPPEASFVRGDCADEKLVETVVRDANVDCVIHCAGVISVTESASDPLKYYDLNVSSAVKLFRAAIRGGARHLLFSSTATVYGARDEAFLSEDMALAPLSPYAASKSMVERILEDVGKAHAVNVGILRYFNVAGADSRGRSGQVSRQSTHLLKIAAEAVVGLRDHVQLTGTDFPTQDGTGIRDYIHVSDLAHAHLAVARELRANPQRNCLYNVGYGRGVSVREMLDCVDRVAGTTLRRVESSRREGDVGRLVADSRRIREELQWSPRFDDLDKIVSDAISWERKVHSNPGLFSDGTF